MIKECPCRHCIASKKATVRVTQDQLVKELRKALVAAGIVPDRRKEVKK